MKKKKHSLYYQEAEGLHSVLNNSHPDTFRIFIIIVNKVMMLALLMTIINY